MATTPTHNIYYPTTSDQISPLASKFASLATSVDTALTNAKLQDTGWQSLTLGDANLSGVAAYRRWGNITCLNINVNGTFTPDRYHNICVVPPAGRLSSIIVTNTLLSNASTGFLRTYPDGGTVHYVPTTSGTSNNMVAVSTYMVS